MITVAEPPSKAFSMIGTLTVTSCVVVNNCFGSVNESVSVIESISSTLVLILIKNSCSL